MECRFAGKAGRSGLSGRIFVRGFSVLVALVVSVALTGVTRPIRPARATATPVPTRAATPAPAPTAAAMPSVVVYPFGTGSNIKPSTGVQAAALFEAVVGRLGGVAVVKPGLGVARADYLTNAVKLGVDYYVSGYLSQVGDSTVALVEQLVSTQSGTIVYSHTADIQSYNDATGEAQTIHDTIAAREESLHTQIVQSQTTAAATPAPVANGTQANLGNLFGSFGRKRGPKATAIPVAVRKPAKGVLVVRVIGGPGTAAGDLVSALNVYYNAKLTNASGANLVTAADGICGTNRSNTIASGTLQERSVKNGFLRKTQYLFTLQIYTCFGAVLAQSNGAGDTPRAAMDAAVNAYAEAHPQNA